MNDWCVQIIMMMTNTEIFEVYKLTRWRRYGTITVRTIGVHKYWVINDMIQWLCKLQETPIFDVMNIWDNGHVINGDNKYTEMLLWWIYEMLYMPFMETTKINKLLMR